jgi:two-component system cell cycle sensor histidine kinase/response regulator CckA
VNSRRGAQGTRFGDACHPGPGDTARMSGSTGTVLVVDDQDIVRDVIRITLERAGYTVLEAASPSAAIELVRGNGAIDLLVTDVVMPEMDAFELANRIAREVPGVRILYTSGYTDAAAEGPFIQKPFTPAELVEKVGGVLAASV